MQLTPGRAAWRGGAGGRRAGLAPGCLAIRGRTDGLCWWTGSGAVPRPTQQPKGWACVCSDVQVQNRVGRSRPSVGNAALWTAVWRCVLDSYTGFWRNPGVKHTPAPGSVQMVKCHQSYKTSCATVGLNVDRGGVGPGSPRFRCEGAADQGVPPKRRSQLAGEEGAPRARQRGHSGADGVVDQAWGARGPAAGPGRLLEGPGPAPGSEGSRGSGGQWTWPRGFRFAGHGDVGQERAGRWGTLGFAYAHGSRRGRLLELTKVPGASLSRPWRHQPWAALGSSVNLRDLLKTRLQSLSRGGWGFGMWIWGHTDVRSAAVTSPEKLSLELNRCARSGWSSGGSLSRV